MPTGISSTSGAQAAAQSGFQQLKLQQARRAADVAEQSAQTLRAQANEARQTANLAQDRARTLAVQSDQAQATAGQARQGLAAIKSLDTLQSSLISAYETAIQSQTRQEAPEAETPLPPVVNTEGQTTGTTINTTA